MAKRLVYLPLGGAGEIGMNFYVYGYGEAGQERFIIVDVGVAFPNNDQTPGVGLIMADASFLLERKDRVEAVFITHAHLDHVGALGMFMGELPDVPIYARPFTAEIARSRMVEYQLDPKQIVVAKPHPEKIEAGPFTVEYVPISHSIPEAAALLIEAEGRRILHSGDFKVDRTPLVGEPFDDDLFRAIGETGVDALVCDSTNVFSTRDGRSEASLEDSIHGLIAGAKGLVVATTFASNVARVRTLAQAGVRAGREVILVGRSMGQMVSAAHKARVLNNMPPVRDPEEFEASKRSRTLVICTGSQGESRAASAWLARDGYMGIKMNEGDLFLYSSKTIPGNERAVALVLNELAMRGVDVVHDDDRYHVSGHANRPDIEHFVKLVNPKMLIPMHGEFRHLRELTKIGRENGRHSMIVPNGSMVEIMPEELRAVDEIQSGRYYRDGKQMISAMDGIVRARLNMAEAGHLSALVNIETAGRGMEPSWVQIAGMSETDSDGTDIAAAIESDIDAALAKMDAKALRSDEAVESAVFRAVKRASNQFYGRKPWIDVFIARYE